MIAVVPTFATIIAAALVAVAVAAATVATATADRHSFSTCDCH